ncbi:DM13 domain-containing protein [Candidatus Wolfebacteria bacterium]|nr:DM13 domain-containing protein [Candidatus Wolfebacteria bacterium]
MKTALWVIGSIAILALLWYFVSPLVLNREVNEPFLVSRDGEPVETSLKEDEGVPVEVQINVATVSDTTTAEEMPDTVMEDAPTNGSLPMLVAEGDFTDADSFHQGSGMAQVYEFEEGGAQVLRLENFMVTNGPDLHVFLAENPTPSGSDDLGEYVDLGELKGNRGNQNYEIPPGIGAHNYNSVVIYCKPFHVVFSVATLLTINYSESSQQ